MVIYLNHIRVGKNTLLSQYPAHFLRKPSTHILLNRMGLQNFDQNKKSDDFYALFRLNFFTLKRKFAKGHFKGQKRPYLCFPTLSVFITSIYIASRADIVGMNSIPEFRYGSLLCPSFKNFACYYWLLAIILAFLPKTWLSKWPWFLKVGLRGVKSKKLGHTV